LVDGTTRRIVLKGRDDRGEGPWARARSVPSVDQRYERMRARLLEAIAEHERGELDHAGLRSTVEAFRNTLDDSHAEVRQALFEADIALEYAVDGRTLDDREVTAALKRMRRNLREALQ
jgi:hypothetical protein